MQKPIAVAVMTIAAEPAAARFPKEQSKPGLLCLSFYEAITTNPY